MTRTRTTTRARSSSCHAAARRGRALPALVGAAAIACAAATGGAAVASAAGGPVGATATSGTPQYATLGTAFSDPLVATVYGLADDAACPDTVTFSAPSSGATAYFSKTGSDTDAVAPVDSSANLTGECTYESSTLYATGTVGTYTVSASAEGGGGAASFTLTNDGIVASSGIGQATQDGTAFKTPLQVTVYARGGPVKGAEVTFTAPASAPSGIFSSTNTDTATATTDAMGVATAPAFTADDTQGTYTVTATTSAVPSSADFTLTNSAAGLAASVTASSGTRQSADIGTSYADPLAAKVTDADGDPVQGAEVTFTAQASASTGAGGSFVGAGESATVATGSDGLAVSPPLQANEVAGAFTVTATTQGLSTVAEFTLTNLGAVSVRAAAGTRQAAVVGTDYAHPLDVEVTGPGGKPLQGVEVTFTAQTSSDGASGSFVGAEGPATATTNASGVAVSPRVQANEVSGTFEVTASTEGLGNEADFTLTNLAAAPASVTPGAGVTQKAPAGHDFVVPFSVTVTDAQKNPVAHVKVTFVAPRHGPSGTFASTRATTATVETDASGVAVAPAFRANGVAGGYIVRASVRGLSPPVAFALVNEAPTRSGTAHRGKHRRGG